MSARLLFEEIANDPLFGDHVALPRGYTDDQCRELKGELATRMAPESLWMSSDALLDCAALLRGIRAAKQNTGLPVHCSRRRANYLPLESRYHNGDPRNTYARTVNTLDRLHRHGLIGQIIGEKWKRRQTMVWLTETGQTATDRLSDPSEYGAFDTHAETIILHDKNKNPIDYPETAQSIVMREELAVINEATAKMVWVHKGKRLVVRPYRRIFNKADDLSRCGRFYCSGDSHQNVKKKARPSSPADRPR
jgi:DNA-binding MarR family transcriptional regulator